MTPNSVELGEYAVSVPVPGGEDNVKLVRGYGAVDEDVEVLLLIEVIEITVMALPAPAMPELGPRVTVELSRG